MYIVFTTDADTTDVFVAQKIGQSFNKKVCIGILTANSKDTSESIINTTSAFKYYAFLKVWYYSTCIHT